VTFLAHSEHVSCWLFSTVVPYEMYELYDWGKSSGTLWNLIMGLMERNDYVFFSYCYRIVFLRNSTVLRRIKVAQCSCTVCFYKFPSSLSHSLDRHTLPKPSVVNLRPRRQRRRRVDGGPAADRHRRFQRRVTVISPLRCYPPSNKRYPAG